MDLQLLILRLYLCISTTFRWSHYHCIRQSTAVVTVTYERTVDYQQFTHRQSLNLLDLGTKWSIRCCVVRSETEEGMQCIFHPWQNVLKDQRCGTWLTAIMWPIAINQTWHETSQRTHIMTHFEVPRKLGMWSSVWSEDFRHKNGSSISSIRHLTNNFEHLRIVIVHSIWLYFTL